MSSIRTRNPSNESFLREYPFQNPESVEQTLTNAQQLFATHAEHSLETRQLWLRTLADAIEQAVDQLATTATEEMGKPIGQARSEVRKCATVCRYYADNAESLLRTQRIDDFAEVRIEPLGPILAIMPWNFPYWQVFRVLVPAILLGNPILLKHAENVWGCATEIETLIETAGLPKGTLQNLFIPVERIPPIIEDQRIRGVTLTGSEAAGRSVAAQAGRAIKPVVLELGGSDPFIVLADADIDAALDAAVKGRFRNNGQSCIAAKRIIVEAPIYDVFVRRYANKVSALKCDDPIFDSTDVGPLARADLRDELERQVRETIGYGARCIVGGDKPSGRGYFFEPTVLADVTETMVPYREELFGPVACLSLAQDADDAIRLGNLTSFGLGASIWTTPERGRTLASRIEAGNVSINGVTASDPRVPFGGIKNSGIGRELSFYGLQSFANIKTVLLSGDDDS